MLQPQGSCDTRTPRVLEGTWLTIARIAWLGCYLALVVLATIGFARAFAAPDLVAVPALAQLVVDLGLSFRAMMFLGQLVPLVVLLLLSAVVFWRRSSDPMALVFTLTLVLLYTFMSRTLLTFETGTVLGHASSIVFALAMVGGALTMALFPDGRFVPRAAVWLAPAMGGVLVAFPNAGRLLVRLLDGDIPASGQMLTLVAGVCGLILTGFAAQVYRYRSVSGPIQRQQARWVIAPLGILTLITTVVLGLAAVPAGPGRWLGWTILITVPVGVVVPVMLVNAVLRYRLYDLDRLLSRTASYALLTVVLAAVYAVGVLGVGRVVAVRTGGDLVVAGSTLVVAGLFRPLRHRLQLVVDKRFHRARYSAAQILEDFAHRLRDEVNLYTVRDDLIATTRNTLTPRQISLWFAASRSGDTVAP